MRAPSKIAAITVAVHEGTCTKLTLGKLREVFHGRVSEDASPETYTGIIRH